MFMSLDDASLVKSNETGTFHLFDFPIESVSSVIFGCRMTPSHKLSILEAINAHAHHHCKFYDAVVNPRMYELDLVQVV